jgi:hypothetical protein
MNPAFISILASASVLAMLCALFGIEAHRGARFFERARAAFDRAVIRLGEAGTRLFRFVGRDIIRQSLHYALHYALFAGLAIIRFIERRLDWLLRRNRALAVRTSRVHTATQTKLDELAEHKQQAALSEEERRAHKERAIGTMLE